MEMAASTPSIAILYLDTGHGFNESEIIPFKIDSGSLTSFQHLSSSLPRSAIYGLRLQILKTDGKVVLRNVEVKNRNTLVQAIDASQMTASSQIATRTQTDNQVEFTTVPNATKPEVELALRRPLPRIVFYKRNFWRLAVINLSLLVLYFLTLAAENRIVRSLRALVEIAGTIHRAFAQIAERYTSGSFLPLDAAALWFFTALMALFCIACALKLNGSSAALYSKVYGNGPASKTLLGRPKESRADEWAYNTPDILNQYYRSDRFQSRDSVLGNHYVALTGNIPVRDISTLFRPQFWTFFILPLDYAYSVYWQAKAFLLIGGIFTFLLWITQNTAWSITGALWYFLSPFTQWSYSWPSALPEMIGCLCLGIVCACYLTVGRSRIKLAAAAAGVVFCGVNFAMCAYLPHLIPLAWIALAVVAGWCVASWQRIVSRSNLWTRAAAIAISAAVLAFVGLHVYSDLKLAISVVAETIYPGRRVLAGGSLAWWRLASDFIQWNETERNFPAVLGNLCEGSGFFWLAPLTLLLLPQVSLSRFQKIALAALWCGFFLVLSWAVLPLPPAFGKFTGLDRSGGARLIPALGLANIAIVALTASGLRIKSSTRKLHFTIFFACCTALFTAILIFANGHLGHYFSTPVLLIDAAFLALICGLFFLRKQLPFALLLLIPMALEYGAINPTQRGLPTFTNSKLHQFIQSHRELLEGKWLVYSATPVRSGFIAASGPEVYTGTRYLPDVDHFPLFSQLGMNLNAFNRLGYLDARALSPKSQPNFVQSSALVVNMEVAPNDELLPKLGIRYVAFDYQPPADETQGLEAVNSEPVDNLWIYRIGHKP